MLRIGWRAWYADGRRFDSRTTTVDQLPADGLVCVVEYLDPPYKNIYHGEFTYYKDGEWGTSSCEKARAQVEYFFPGKLMPDEDWEALQAEAMESVWL